MSSYGPPDDFICEFKVCLLGDSGVGKSCIVTRFATNTFESCSLPTVGAAFMSKVIVVEDQEFKIHIWDTAGQEKYRSLAPLYYRNVSAAILVYDITSETSFLTLQEWRRQLKRYGPPHVVIAVAGNKFDKDFEREVSTQEAQEYAKSIDAIFAETSAKTSRNVNFIFEELCKRLIKENIIRPYNMTAANIELGPAAKGKGCCFSQKKKSTGINRAEK